jgi:hypothetical protein
MQIQLYRPEQLIDVCLAVGALPPPGALWYSTWCIATAQLLPGLELHQVLGVANVMMKHKHQPGRVWAAAFLARVEVGWGGGKDRGDRGIQWGVQWDTGAVEGTWGCALGREGTDMGPSGQCPSSGQGRSLSHRRYIASWLSTVPLNVSYVITQQKTPCICIDESWRSHFVPFLWFSGAWFCTKGSRCVDVLVLLLSPSCMLLKPGMEETLEGSCYGLNCHLVL